MQNLIYTLRSRCFGNGLLLSLVLLLEACHAQPLGPGNDFRANADREVRIQVCLPGKRVYFNELQLDHLQNHPLFTKYSQQQLELAPKTVLRVASLSDPRVDKDPRSIRSYGISFGEALSRSGGYSYGSGFMPLAGSTGADQPVFEKGYGNPAGNYVAVSVRFPEGNMKSIATSPVFWFRLSKTIPPDGFSNWFSADSMETNSSPGSAGSSWWYRLAHGGDLPVQPVAIDSPKIRVALRQRPDTHDDPAIDTLPALTTARLKFRTASSDSQFVYEFVAKTNEGIPKCD